MPRRSRRTRSAAGWKACCSSAVTDLYGIINGVDYDIWDPANDPHLPLRYDASTWREGKAACKQSLCARTGAARRHATGR